MKRDENPPEFTSRSVVPSSLAGAEKCNLRNTTEALLRSHGSVLPIQRTKHGFGGSAHLLGTILCGGGSSVSERPSEPSPENDIDNADTSDTDETLERVKLEPIRTVVRELKRPDGSTVTVEVPVYPPFELKDISSQKDIPSRAGRKPSAIGKQARSK